MGNKDETCERVLNRERNGLKYEKASEIERPLKMKHFNGSEIERGMGMKHENAS